MYEEYLMHHGVKGMKWGVRKKQESSGNNQQSVDKKKKLKKAFAIAGGVAGAAALATGGAIAYKNRKKISSAMGKKLNAGRINTLNVYKDYRIDRLSNLLEYANDAKGKGQTNAVRKLEKSMKETNAQAQAIKTLVTRLESAPMTKKQYYNGLAELRRLGVVI